MIRTAAILLMSFFSTLQCMIAQDSPENDYDPASAFRQEFSTLALLKNQGSLLPLNKKKLSSIALIGPAAFAPGKGGAAFATLYDALAGMAGDSLKIFTAPGINMKNDVMRLDSALVYIGQGVNGFSAKYYKGVRAAGTPAKFKTDKFIDFYWPGPPLKGPDTSFSVSWDATLIPAHGPVKAKLIHSDGCRLYLNGELLIDAWQPGPVRVDSAWLKLEKGQSCNLQIDYFSDGGPAVVKFGFDYLESNMLWQAAERAKRADIAVVVIGQPAVFNTDGTIANATDIPRQSKLVRTVWEANPNTIVVLQTPGPVDIESWAFDVPVILQSGAPSAGSAREAVAALFDIKNPAGKLPYRWAMNANQNFATRFPFGHGLSYTTFGIGKLLMHRNRDGNGWTATIEIKNMSKRTGTEVLQLYVVRKQGHMPGWNSRIKAFKSVTLLPGHKKTVSISLPREAFRYFNTEDRQWQVEEGMYEILAGTSAENIKLRKTIEIKAEHLIDQ